MTPKIIAVANTKGGVGKTTVAIQIAAARALQGKDVWFVDGDQQQTGMMALTLREKQNTEVFISCAAYSNASMLGTQIPRQADKWDTIIIDVGGFDSMTMRMALGVCDLLLVPYQPRTFDTWALTQMSTLVEEMSTLRGGTLPAYAILNCADPNSQDNKDAIDALAQTPAIKYLECSLGRRKAFANASGFGLGVAEMKVKDFKAISEVKALMKAIFGDEEDEGPAKKKRGRPRKNRALESLGVKA